MNKRVTRPAAKPKVAASKNRRSTQKAQLSSAIVSSGGAQGTGVIRAWVTHHRSSCHNALSRFLQTPFQSLLVCLVLAIALTLPAALYAGLNSLGQFSGQWQNHTRLSAYINLQAKPLAVEQLQQQLQTMPELDAVELVTPEQAKQEFIQHSGLGELLEGLDSNPLPAVLLLQPAATINTYEQLQQLRYTLEQELLIDTVQIDLEWLQRLQAVMDIAQRLIIALGILLVMGMLLNLANTIRLTIENRRKEIIVSKLVGATDAFIRRPFLYTGLCYGLGGGILAVLLLQLLDMWLIPVIDNLALLYESEYSLSLLGFDFALYIIAISALLGLVAAWLAIIRTLRGIEPE